MSPEPIYTATADERTLATDWHGGQASMLYAVSSTGALSLGTIRPSWSPSMAQPDPEPFTDDEWRRDLVERLRREVTEVVTDAEGMADASDPLDPARSDLLAARETARGWARKLDAWLAEHPA